ncbi:MAG: hypothetical protein HXK70_03860 [Clostridiales bacterium]|nr:hypothetical protein [Clostridiales bacterium]
MYKRKELSPEELRAISKKLRRNIIFVEKIISKEKNYIFIKFIDENKNKYLRVYENELKVHNLIFSNKSDLDGKQTKSDIRITKQQKNVLQYLGLS